MSLAQVVSTVLHKAIEDPHLSIPIHTKRGIPVMYVWPALQEPAMLYKVVRDLVLPIEQGRPARPGLRHLIHGDRARQGLLGALRRRGVGGPPPAYLRGAGDAAFIDYPGKQAPCVPAPKRGHSPTTNGEACAG